MDAKLSKRIAPKIRSALPLAIFFQAFAAVFSGMILDAGWTGLVTMIAIAVYWAWFGFLIFLRGSNPTHLDVLAAKFGFPALWIIAFGLGLFFEKFHTT